MPTRLLRFRRGNRRRRQRRLTWMGRTALALGLALACGLGWGVHAAWRTWRPEAAAELPSVSARAPLPPIGEAWLEAPPRSRERFELAQEYNPNYWPTLLNLGILETEQGRRLEAIKLFRKILELEPAPVAAAEANYRIAEIFIANLRGAKVCVTSRGTDYFKADEDWFQSVARTREPDNGALSFDERSEIVAVPVYLPVFNPTTSRFLGVARALVLGGPGIPDAPGGAGAESDEGSP